MDSTSHDPAIDDIKKTHDALKEEVAALLLGLSRLSTGDVLNGALDNAQRILEFLHSVETGPRILSDSQLDTLRESCRTMLFDLSSKAIQRRSSSRPDESPSPPAQGASSVDSLLKRFRTSNPVPGVNSYLIFEHGRFHGMTIAPADDGVPDGGFRMMRQTYRKGVRLVEVSVQEVGPLDNLAD